MNKHARVVAIEPLNETDQQSRTHAERLQLKKQKEEAIKIQLAEFALEIEQLKQLHKSC